MMTADLTLTKTITDIENITSVRDSEGDYSYFQLTFSDGTFSLLPVNGADPEAYCPSIGDSYTQTLVCFHAPQNPVTEEDDGIPW